MKAQLHKPKLSTIVRIPINGIDLEGELVIPPTAQGLVIFAHGSGSSRHSPRNQFVARQLRKSSLATLLVDLLSDEEDIDYQNRFNIELLTERLMIITDWVEHNEQTEHLAVGYFGASTGAAAAMQAAVLADDTVKAVVSRGGRVDLAGQSVASLTVPTLLIVGQRDFGVREANQTAYFNLKCHKELAELPEATHLFEEPGALDAVARLASAWFKEHLEG